MFRTVFFGEHAFLDLDRVFADDGRLHQFVVELNKVSRTTVDISFGNLQCVIDRLYDGVIEDKRVCRRTARTGHKRRRWRRRWERAFRPRMRSKCLGRRRWRTTALLLRSNINSHTQTSSVIYLQFITGEVFLAVICRPWRLFYCFGIKPVPWHSGHTFSWSSTPVPPHSGQ